MYEHLMPTLIRTIGDAVHAILEATKSIWYKVRYILVIMPMTKSTRPLLIHLSQSNYSLFPRKERVSWYSTLMTLSA